MDLFSCHSLQFRVLFANFALTCLMFCCISVLSASLHCHSRQRSGTLVAAHRHNSMPLDIHRLLRSAVPQRAESVGGAGGGVPTTKACISESPEPSKPMCCPLCRALPQRAEPLGGAAGGLLRIPAANCLSITTNTLENRTCCLHRSALPQRAEPVGGVGGGVPAAGPRLDAQAVAGLHPRRPPAGVAQRRCAAPLGTALGLTCTWAGLGLSARVQGLTHRYLLTRTSALEPIASQGT